jgi:hypothetical protein
LTDDPVARYKELLGIVSQATQRMADHERRRATELAGELTAAKRAIGEASEAETKVGTEISAWWQRIATRMTGLRWITPGPRPIPDPNADPAELDTYLAAIEPATDELQGALRRAGGPARPS